ncbi:MAG TPA: nucleoside/nucleotide kinase family protein [Deltaproteobacteria bacterium]|nr:nucleoside/nucleotide kinase family protein [Deltaproteobacteria bacterium]|tara:strand:+ start:2517 stop:3152 length:636 start_codon:yes stop_codon:yes gene_type:complete
MAPRIELKKLQELIQQRSSQGRILVALAGPPGSGKSTLADELESALNQEQSEQAMILPMDGFHYDDLYLVPAGLRPRKGAPQTFDVWGFYHILRRLRERQEEFVAVPVFDRDLEIARAGARLIPAKVPVILVEGNYLLLQQEPWSQLRLLFDVAVLLEVPEAVLGERLTARWQHYELPSEEIAAKVNENDLPNGRYVMAESGGEDYRLKSG